MISTAITTETQKGHNYLRCTKRVNKACSQRYVREEDIAEQICNVLSGLDIPDDWFEWMLGELERHSRLAKFDAVETVRRTERQLIEVDQKIDRLTDAYVETAISLDEFRRAKNERVKEKEDLKAQLVGLKQNSDKRFEPAKEFILACKQAVFLSRGTETTKQSEMFKKIGSNPILVNRKIRFSPREAWKLVVNQGSFAQPAAARESPAADVCGETHHDFNKRREGDSNPRYGYPYTAFPVLLLRPLGHLSSRKSREGAILRGGQNTRFSCRWPTAFVADFRQSRSLECTRSWKILSQRVR